jgi:hypothetical protein
MPRIRRSPPPSGVRFNVILSGAGNGMEQGLAGRAEVSQGAVNGWRRNGVPFDRVLQIAAISGVPVWEIRPDIYSHEALATAFSAHLKQHN